MGLFSFLFSRKPPALPEALGPRAEEVAARFLAEKGMRILERNHRCRSGEVDLICRDGDTVVFVEVRLRSDEEHGGAAASITPTKRRRIIQAARHWLSGKPESPCRFDCILLTRPEPEAIEWIKGAFDTK